MYPWNLTQVHFLTTEVELEVLPRNFSESPTTGFHSEKFFLRCSFFMIFMDSLLVLQMSKNVDEKPVDEKQEALTKSDDESPEKHKRPLDERPLDENRRKMFDEMDQRIESLGMDTRTVVQALNEFKRQRATAGNSDAAKKASANEFLDMIKSIHEPLFKTLPEEELEHSASTDVSNEAKR